MDSSFAINSNTVRLDINTLSELLPRNLGFGNIIAIDLLSEVEELLEDENGMVTQLDSYPGPLPVSRIELEPRNLTPRHISRLLHQVVVETQFCQILAERISLDSSSLPGPFVLYVRVVMTREIRFILPSVSVPSKASASDDLLRRLVEEQRVDLVEEEEEEATCSICMEDLSEPSSESDDDIIRLPNCLHMFHQGCIFEWLKRQNSCPLCRKVPYGEDHETETQVLA